MDYYKEKRTFYEWTRNIIKNAGNQGVDYKMLNLAVMERFGYGKKLLNDYLEKLAEADLINVKGDRITWKGLN